MKNLEELSYDVEKEWKREADAMKEFNRLGHAHITCALAAFKQNQKYYLILEWADGGNLRDFWVANPQPQLTENKIREFIGQLWGLADALDQIHNSTMPALQRTRTAVETPSPAISVKDSSLPNPVFQLNGVDGLDHEPAMNGIANGEEHVQGGKVYLKYDHSNCSDFARSQHTLHYRTSSRIPAATYLSIWQQ